MNAVAGKLVPRRSLPVARMLDGFDPVFARHIGDAPARVDPVGGGTGGARDGQVGPRRALPIAGLAVGVPSDVDAGGFRRLLFRSYLASRASRRTARQDGENSGAGERDDPASSLLVRSIDFLLVSHVLAPIRRKTWNKDNRAIPRLSR